MGRIEDIILGDDRRGIAALRPYLADEFCDAAARSILSASGTALIATGFYISMAGAPETDGPPGALAIGRALESMGWRVVYVSDRYTVPILRQFANSESQVVDFPITGDDASSQFASDLLATLDPSLLISIERCGPTVDGSYLNMRGVDITAQTAMIDRLFSSHSHTVGIGDGGNEIGMGNLAEYVPRVPSLPSRPAATCTTHLVISSTSNWGGYGLVAALSLLVGRNLLPNLEDEEALIRRLVDLGAVDGVTGESRYSVDAMTLEEHGRALWGLHRLVAGAAPGLS